jgi:predicted  nucleic acid-binding Zn-ribbon protein
MKSNGHDPATTQMIAVLERIELEIRGMRKDFTGSINTLTGRVDTLTGRIDALVERVEETNAELAAFKQEVSTRLTDLHHTVADTNVRVTDLSNEVRVEVGGRLNRLEDAVFKPTGT